MLAEVAWRAEDGASSLVVDGSAAAADGEFLSVTAWADCIALELTSLRNTGALGGALGFSSAAIAWTLPHALDGATSETHASAAPAADGTVGLRLCSTASALEGSGNGSGSGSGSSSGSGSVIGSALTAADLASGSPRLVTATYNGASLTVEWDAAAGETRVHMPSNLPSCGYTQGCGAMHEIAVSVASAPAAMRLRLVLTRNFHRTRNFYSNQPGSEITGVSAVWFEPTAAGAGDAALVPSGRRVQVSKNWHVDSSTPSEPYEGTRPPTISLSLPIPGS